MTNPRTILIVDDDVPMLLALQKRLEHAGYHVLAAGNGPDALRMVQDNGIDAISLDVGLPGDMDGLSLARLLQADPHTAGIPVIFITGAAHDDFKQKCRAVGGRYFLAKPYDPDLLLDLLRGIFGTDELAELRRLSDAKRRQPVL
jgi:CheY-like chemotaxis protein